MNWPPFVPPPASQEAVPLNGVLIGVHWHIALVFGLWALGLLYLIWRFRAGRETAAVRPMPMAGPLAAVLLAIGGEVLLLFGSALPVWSARMLPPANGTEVVHIRVIAEQFAWNLHYPGLDRTFGATRPGLIDDADPVGIDRRDPAAADDLGLSNVLTVPTGRTTMLHLSTRDVIHNFSLVEMRVKQDINPGMITRTWFTPTVNGTWDIICSQLCGLGHYRMKGVLRVLPEAEWQQWLRAEIARGYAP